MLRIGEKDMLLPPVPLPWGRPPHEVVFFHPPSRALVLTGLAFNRRTGGRNHARLSHWLVGTTDRFGPHRLVRTMIRDHEATCSSVDMILRWDFDRIVVTYG